MQIFPTVDSCKMVTMSVCDKLGGALGLLGWILYIKGGTQKKPHASPSLKFCEVSESLKFL